MGRVSALNAAYEYRVTEIDMAGGARQVAPNDPDRWALVFAGGPAANSFVRPDRAPDATGGIPITPGMGPVTFDGAKHPGLVAANWWCAAGGAGVLTVIEIYQSKREG